MTIAYLNGDYLPLEQVKISAMDRGFLFGDGIYEVIPVYHAKPFRLAQHLQRLQNSLAAIQLEIPLNGQALEEIFNALIAHNGGENQSIYVQCTRGPAPVRDHPFPLHIQPTIFAYSVPLLDKKIDELKQGIKAITVNDMRWQRCDIKSINLLANVLLRQQAIDANAFEAILINDNLALEGSSSNLFIVKDNTIITPPLSEKILGGITRDLVLELAEGNNYSVQQRNIPVTELNNADEIWLTSSTREIMPVIQLNDTVIGKGEAGPVWHNLIQYYQAFKQQISVNY